MIKSMTGFGRAEKQVDGRDIIVEIKSVNHRYLEFSCRAPRNYGFLEEKMKTFVQQYVSRGKLEVYVSVGAKDEEEAVVKINHSLAAGYINALKELGETYHLPNDISVANVARYADIFNVHKATEDEDIIWNDVKGVAAEALEAFVKMRETEGERLKADVMNRSETILEIVSEIEKRSPETVEEYRNKLFERMKEILEASAIDEQRILTEAAIFADKVAVAEETVRLRSHFEQLFTMLNSSAPTGRKIDFILQEMNRETNTIGSKVQDAVLAHMVVDIKAELEKIREQIQNIE